MASGATTEILVGAKIVIRLVLVVSLWSGAVIAGDEKPYGRRITTNQPKTTTLLTVAAAGSDLWSNLTSKESSIVTTTGRSSITALCLLLFKVIKFACVCTFFFLLFLIICPFIPAIAYSLVFTFFLVGLLGLLPIALIRPPPTSTTAPVEVPITSPPIVFPPITLPTTTPEPTTEPPFTSIPAVLRPVEMPPPFVSIPARILFNMGIVRFQ